MKPALANDLFTAEQSRADEQREDVQEIALSELYPFKNHPFKVVNDERMRDTAESIREHGVLVPAIARLRESSGYEIVPGHRRKRACELVGMETMPVIVRELDDDAATLVMVDSNIQRESLFPSERAFAYKMELDALNRRMGRPSMENVGQVVPTFSGKRSTEIVGEQAGESYKQVQRYVRLTELIPELLDMLDELVELMVEALFSRRETISVSGEEHLTWLVQERLRKLNAHHIDTS